RKAYRAIAGKCNCSALTAESRIISGTTPHSGRDRQLFSQKCATSPLATTRDRFARKLGLRHRAHTTKLYQSGKKPKTAISQVISWPAPMSPLPGLVRPPLGLDFAAQSRLLCDAKLVGGFDGCLSSVADAPP